MNRWPALAIVAKAPAEGKDMAEIGLMCAIAAWTILVQRERARS
jgi:hypothetical protein